MSCFHTVGPLGRIKHDIMFRRSSPGGSTVGCQTTIVFGWVHQNMAHTHTHSHVHAYMHASIHTCTHTHMDTHLFYGPLDFVRDFWGELVPEPILILLEQETVSGSSISWAICKSALCSRQITMQHSTTQFYTGRMPFLPPNQQRQSNESHSSECSTGDEVCYLRLPC